MHKWNQTRYNNYSTRRKRIINYKRLLLSLGFLCIITLMSMAYGSFFAIEDIQVRRNKNISTEEILAAIDFYIDTNLLAVRSEEVKHALQETIPIEDVIVRYRLPHTLILEVKEREISAALNYLHGFALIDSKGFVVKLVSRLENYTIPVVTGLNLVDAKVAEKPIIQQNMVHFKALLELIDCLKPILQELSEINLVIDKNHEAAFYLYTLDGYQVFLKEYDEEKIKILQELIVDIRKKCLGKGLLDISHNTPIFKPFQIETGEERR